MTVKELIDALAKEDLNRLVIMAKDAEGNGYSPISHFWTGAYLDDTGWSGEAGLEKLTPEDEEGGYGEEDVISHGIPAVILCPMN